MPATEVKNRLIINNLVRDYFALGPKSYKLFRHRLLYERNLPTEFEKIFQEFGEGDGRIRVPLKGEMLERFDTGWSDFKAIFQNFQIYYSRDKYSGINGITYKEFRSGKALIKKQIVKIKKIVFDYYFNNAHIAATGWSLMNETIYALVKLKAIEKFEKMKYGYRERIYVDLQSYSVCQNSGWNVSLESGEVVCVSQDEIRQEKIYAETLEKLIMRDFEEIGTKKISNKSRLEMVFSVNFADWFLSSTGESWTSCINLESSYGGAMWGGLPALIGDKSRFLVYITNGEKKNYKGIEVDKLLYRAWGLWARGKSWDNENFMFLFKTYPLPDMILDRIANDCFKKMFEKHIPKFKGFTVSFKEGCVSRHYSELFFNHSKVDDRFSISKIFYDNNIGVSIASNNKTKFFPHQFAYYKLSGDNYGPSTTYYYEEPIGRNRPIEGRWRDYVGFNCSVGLSGVMQHGLSLKNYNAYNVDELNDYLYDLGVA